MTLEISEIAIRMRVADAARGREERGDKVTSGGGCRDLEREELVDDCVRRVLDVLRGLERR
jgi:hypothetical protein